MSEKKIFVRPVSGLVREMSPFGAFLYGVFATGVFFTLEYFWPFGVGFFQGTNMPLIGVFALITGGLVSTVYAGVGSAMPRSGGDYIYQSRILHLPWLGFAIGFGWFALTWIVTGVFGGMVIAKWLNNFFIFQGYLHDNPGWIAFGNSVYSPWGMFIIDIILATTAAIVCLHMRWYLNVQRYVLLPMLVITTITFLVLLIKTTPSSFIDGFNFWMLRFTGDANYYNTVITLSQEIEYVPPASTNFYSTTLAYCLPGVYMCYTVFAGQGLLGEVKGAGSFKSLFWVFFGGILYTSGVIFTIITALMQHVFGWDFLNILAATFWAGQIELPFELSYFTLSMCLTKSSAVMIFMGLASLAGAWYMMATCFLIASRIWLAQSLDGVLPEWFVEVHKRLHAPVHAMFAQWVMVFIWIVLFCFVPGFFWAVYSGFNFVWWCGMIPTAIAAILFPKLLPEVYKTSPVSQYHPLLQVVGVLMLIIFSYTSWQIWFHPYLGAAAFVPRFTVSVLFFGSLIYFFARRAWLKRKGVDLDLVYKEIPPE